MIAIYTLVVGLATFVIVYMLRWLNGPFDVFVHVRTYVYEEWSTGKVPPQQLRPKLAELWDCEWCLGTWVSLILSIVAGVLGIMPITYIPLVWFAAIAVEIVMFKWLVW